MSSHLAVRNFDTYQHYKNRRPPWVKLHVKILEDEDMAKLSDSTRLLAILFLCVAANRGNRIPVEPQWIATEVGMSKAKVRAGVSDLLASRFLIEVASGVASGVASNVASDLAPKMLLPEVETEKETEKPFAAVTPRQKPAPRQRNEIWDALTEVFGEATTETAQSQRGKVCRSLASANASADEILRRARSWPRHFDGATLTELALEKHWDALGRSPLRAARS